jgi:hypothetical protein
MKDIIEAANQKRFKVDEGDDSKKGILISESWMQELMKHPYYSSKLLMNEFCRKTRYWYLLDEREC